MMVPPKKKNTKSNFYIQNENQISTLALDIWLWDSSDWCGSVPKPLRVCSSLVETIPHCDHLPSTERQNQPFFPFIFSLVFPKKPTKEHDAAFSLFVFWTAPTEETEGDMQHVSGPPKWRNAKYIPKKIRGLLAPWCITQLSPDVPKDLCRSKPPQTSSSLAAAYPQMLSPSDTDPPPLIIPASLHLCSFGQQRRALTQDVTPLPGRLKVPPSCLTENLTLTQSNSDENSARRGPCMCFIIHEPTTNSVYCLCISWKVNKHPWAGKNKSRCPLIQRRFGNDGLLFTFCSISAHPLCHVSLLWSALLESHLPDAPSLFNVRLCI